MRTGNVGQLNLDRIRDLHAGSEVKETAVISTLACACICNQRHARTHMYAGMRWRVEIDREREIREGATHVPPFAVEFESHLRYRHSHISGLSTNNLREAKEVESRSNCVRLSMYAIRCEWTCVQERRTLPTCTLM